MDKPQPTDKSVNVPDTARDAKIDETIAISSAGLGTHSRGPGPSFPYELLNEIARGGMGVVYKARQKSLNRIVAVKMILGGQLASPEQVKRFLVEAEAAANLDHPGIVPVYEFGEHEGDHYFSMAFVDGPSLDRLAADRPLSPTNTAEIVAQVCDAVQYAHQQGVIHRDLKPANILMENGQHPRITDFGIAKRIEDDSELTKTGTIMGSVFYMAPEQAAGRATETGPAADVYSLGAILYKLLTGRPPFQAENVVETITQVVGHEPVPPRRLNPRVPLDLETICLKCLEKEPHRRYSSALQLGDELRRFLVGQPIQARPIGRLAHLWRWCRRNPLPASLAAGLLLALLIGVFTATNLWNRAISAKKQAQDQQQMVGVLSNLVLKKTLDETTDWLRLFFAPVKQELLVARSWGQSGLLDSENPAMLTDLLAPVIEHYPQISSLMVADDRGREYMLLCQNVAASDSQPANRHWRCRQVKRDEWGDIVKWMEWNDLDQRKRTRDVELADYDPRQRPWFIGATSLGESSSSNSNQSSRCYWTDPYVFFTTKDLGITVSIPFDSEGKDNLVNVVAFDVLLQDISSFTSKKKPTPNGMVLVLNDAGMLVGIPSVGHLQSPEEWKQAFLKKPSELGLSVITRGAEQFSFSDQINQRVRRFRSEGRYWWAATQPFSLNPDRRLWILVIVPETDLLQTVTDPTATQKE